MSERLERLLQATGTPDADRRRAAAAAAVVLLSLAGADGKTSSVETVTIGRALRDVFALSPSVITEILAVAKGTEVAAEHTDVIRGFSYSDKIRVAETMREIIWSDGALHDDESRTAAWVSTAIGLPINELRRILAAP